MPTRPSSASRVVSTPKRTNSTPRPRTPGGYWTPASRSSRAARRSTCSSSGVIDKEYVQTGKIGGIVLSEVRAETIHEAVKYTKIMGVEVELSIFTPDILDNGVAAACA
ncbi:pyridoxine 4-dehydrogenase [Aspergillus puulaauensis]|uniref:Pyridoxine 4-dehydrogenase n=1 Tax=Aspergillus puulaauensis TaxID=1220207 RepID=A0A7R7XNV4_9EURO|nr:pyridoxine 4-dehydrogenase [Aspergillus puulaauensis]BCS24273.1 pyridoxine 4-dehydrogenase [Aspergillus puulaauensis]